MNANPQVKIDNPSKFKATPCGNRIEKTFESKYDENLKREVVVQTGTLDIYEYIQASKAQSDIAMLKEQMIRTGEIPSIDPGISADLSYMPQDIHELHNVVNNASDTFDKLPDSIKGAFSGADDFVNALVSGTYSEKVSKHVSSLYEKEQAEAAAKAKAAEKKDGE